MRNELGQFASEGKCKKIDGHWYRRRCTDCDKWLKGTYAVRCKEHSSMYYSVENAHRWKGNSVGYAGLHLRIKKILKKPKLCEMCKVSNKRLNLANKSQKYLHSVDDWFYLCYNCHSIYDHLTSPAWIALKGKALW